MILGGIDGCRAGWFLVKWNGSSYENGIYASLQAMIAAHPDLQRIMIDMPLGMGSSKVQRTLEQQLRKELPGRAATVFNPPCREALYAPDEQEAKAINLKIENKSLSIQTLNILLKIRELDKAIRTGDPAIQWIESHPELCFKYLNGHVLLSRKSRPEGIQERLSILTAYEAGIPDHYSAILNSTQREEVRKDDVLDAFCLCLVNRLAGRDGLSFLTNDPARDDVGIPMQIGFFNPSSASFSHKK